VKRRHLLAAELFAYSFDHYRDHLEVSHPRFRKLMPADVERLERARDEKRSDDWVAKELDVSLSTVPELRARFERALDIVDAATPAEAFRRGVRYSIKDAVEEGLTSADAIERLVVQICYRAADLSVLLDSEESTLSDYSAELRAESSVSGLDGEDT